MTALSIQPSYFTKVSEPPKRVYRIVIDGISVPVEAESAMQAIEHAVRDRERGRAAG